MHHMKVLVIALLSLWSSMALAQTAERPTSLYYSTLQQGSLGDPEHYSAPVVHHVYEVSDTPHPEAPSVFEPDDKVRLFGVTLGAGLPDGFLVGGLAFHPWTNALHLDLTGTGGLAGFGIRGGVTLDPFDSVVAPTLTIALGHMFWADIPRHAGEFDYTYLNVQPGIEVGRRSRFRVFARVGYSRIWASTRGVVRPFNIVGVTFPKQPSFIVDLLPSLSVGVNFYL